MVAAAIFLCLFGLLVATLRRSPSWSVVVFFVALGLVVLLFLHHATDQLQISL